MNMAKLHTTATKENLVTPHSFSSTPNSQFPALTNEVTWTQPNLLRDTNNPLADRLCPTHCPSRSPSSNATSPIYSLGTTALNTQSYLSQDSPFNTEEILDIDKALELLSSPTHTIDPLPASQGSKSSHPSAAKDEGNSKIERALKVLSEHLAQSDKLTTTDLIALSHLQDRIKESRGR